MPSIAKATWDDVAAVCLDELEQQCRACSTTANPNSVLLEENLRAYVILLSGHFQAFCRDLYSECAIALALSVPLPMKVAIQTQCLTRRELEKGNARSETLKIEFDRFGLNLAAEFALDASNAPRLTHLDLLNKWRNFAAHRENSRPKAGTLDLPHLRTWRQSCGELAIELESIMYNYMATLIGRKVW